MSGDLYEQLFIYEALKRGINISRPVKAEPYDFIAEKNGQTKLIQVKSAVYDDKGNYRFKNGRGAGKKTKYKIIDIFAFYLAPVGVWFLIPLKDVKDQTAVTINYNNATSKYYIYEENWDSIF